ncbi:TonB C-terminal domain-containing protein [bacterium]|nr:TonB C-terminal domain-containing protein [bacterium]QQR58930.1 MAG: TonB C-terminal domain-containing protein [Candidatus Melainabacteria bacterium]
MSGIFRLSVLVILCLALNSSFISVVAKQNTKSPIKSSINPPPLKAQKRRSSTPASFSSSMAGAYLDRLREKMDKHWYLADGTNHVVIKATVAANGSVDNVELSSSPKNEAAEQAANEAFLKAQPLESLPSGSGDKCLVILDMDSYADPHGDSRRTVKSRMEVIKPTNESAPAKE